VAAPGASLASCARIADMGPPPSPRPEPVPAPAPTTEELLLAEAKSSDG
jgi:hypothetical protein